MQELGAQAASCILQCSLHLKLPHETPWGKGKTTLAQLKACCRQRSSSAGKHYVDLLAACQSCSVCVCALA